MTRVVAIVPARDEAASVGEVVDALRPAVDDVVVVDDASRDATAAEALAHGATVLSLPAHTGKGGAVAAGAGVVRDADVFLLVDADTGSSAAAATTLLPPVLEGRADMAIAVPPPGATGGLGAVRRLAAAGIARACGFRARAPLSGQRAVRAGLLRGLTLAPRFGLETAMTIDAVRAGATVVELDVAMTHRRTGHSPAGWAHRARQGADVLGVLWRRIPGPGRRLAAVAVVTATLASAAVWSGWRAEPSSRPADGGAARVVIFAAPYLSWSDVGTGRMPQLDALIRRGALAALNVRTVSDQPSSAEAWATAGAGTRTAASASDASVVVLGGQAVVPAAARLWRDSRRAHRVSPPGALGRALESAGHAVAVVGDSTTGEALAGRPPGYAPVALAAMDGGGRVAGEVGPNLLVQDPAMAFGLSANGPAVLAGVDRALRRSDVVLVDPGDLERAAAFDTLAAPAGAAAARARALAGTDAVLGLVAGHLPASTLLLVASVVPPTRTWHTEPLVAVGAGVAGNALFSPSTGRRDLATLDDLAPTVLAALGVTRPPGMAGQPLRYRNEKSPVQAVKHLDRQAVWREAIYFRTAVGFIVFQCLVYLAAAVVHRRRERRWTPAVRRAAVLVAAWPVATYLLRAWPGADRLGAGAVAVLAAMAVALAAVASFPGRDRFAPLVRLMCAALAVVGVDLATGARLQTASILGYSLHTASRYRGLGNTAFAVVAAATLVVAAIHVEREGRAPGVMAEVACLFALGLVFVAAPPLGAKVGGALVLAAVLPVTWLRLAGRPVRGRDLALGALVGAVVIATAALFDLARPPRARTHLGRFTADLLAGRTTIGATVHRRVATDLHHFKTGWNIAIVVLALGLLVALVTTRLWAGLVPAGSPGRIGAAAVLAAGLLGTVLEDSGSIVAATVFVFLGPWLVVRVLESDRPAPALRRPPAPAAVAVGTGT
jgi:Glycosyl transferase family 2